MSNRDEIIGAAMLAKMVGSHLNGVDQLTIDRSSGQKANKIVMENFVAPLLGKKTNSNRIDAGASPEMVKAYEGLNELALRSIPDPVSRIENSAPVSNSETPPQGNITEKCKQEKNQIVTSTSILTRSDIDSIRNSLRGIDKSLSIIAESLKSKTTTTTTTNG